MLVENEVVTGGRERKSLDTQFCGYKGFCRATPKDLVAGDDFEDIERGKHGVTHPSGRSFVPIVRDSGLSRSRHQILDLCMPEMNGFEDATVLQKTMPQVPLFLFTSHQNRDVASQAASAGIRAVSCKQTDINGLVEQASELLGEPQPQPMSQLCELFRTPRFNTTVMSTPIAAPNTIHFPMLCVAAPIAAPIAIPRAIPILITIAVSPDGAFLPIFATHVCPIEHQPLNTHSKFFDHLADDAEGILATGQQSVFAGFAYHLDRGNCQMAVLFVVFRDATVFSRLFRVFFQVV